MNWKANLVVLAVVAGAFSGIRGLASLAEAGTTSPIACYAALVSDIAPLIDTVDATTSGADCLVVSYRLRSRG
jgi:hypothetical protein